MAMGKSLWLNESQQMTGVGTSSARLEYYPTPLNEKISGCLIAQSGGLFQPQP
jgi:hypothetical protein